MNNKECRKSFRLFFIILFFIIICNCTNDYIKNLGNGYIYRDEGGEIKDILHEYLGEIPATIISYSYDEKYIIAKQKPKLPQEPLYEKKHYYYNGVDTIYYWIVIKNKNIILGPFDKTMFYGRAFEYDISDKLLKELEKK